MDVRRQKVMIFFFIVSVEKSVLRFLFFLESNGNSDRFYFLGF